MRILTVMQHSQGKCFHDQISENAYMILTTNSSWVADGIGVPGVSTYGIELVDLARMIVNQKDEFDLSTNFRRETGNVQYLKQLVEHLDPSKEGVTSNKKKILKLETLLDADDGLHNRGIEMIQQNSIEYARQQPLASHPTLNSTWWHFCKWSEETFENLLPSRVLELMDTDLWTLHTYCYCSPIMTILLLPP